MNRLNVKIGEGGFINKNNLKFGGLWWSRSAGKSQGWVSSLRDAPTMRVWPIICTEQEQIWGWEIMDGGPLNRETMTVDSIEEAMSCAMAAAAMTL